MRSLFVVPRSGRDLDWQYHTGGRPEILLFDTKRSWWQLPFSADKLATGIFLHWEPRLQQCLETESGWSRHFWCSRTWNGCSTLFMSRLAEDAVVFLPVGSTGKAWNVTKRQKLHRFFRRKSSIRSSNNYARSFSNRLLTFDFFWYSGAFVSDRRWLTATKHTEYECM